MRGKHFLKLTDFIYYGHLLHLLNIPLFL